jgi:thiamine-monophosphate kinase
VVALAGTTGSSAAGLAVLENGIDPAGFERLVALHLRPRPPYPAGPAAARAGATAMIDISDGLLRDALRVARSSGVRLDLDPAALPADADVVTVAGKVGADPADWVLGGGEDHALLATFPPGTALPPQFRAVGEVRAAAETPDVLVAGTPWPGSPGWQHFTS